MGLMNSVVKHTAVAATMRELSKEMMKAGVMEEMVNDAMVSALDADGELEEETEAQVEQLLAELAVESVGAMPAAGRAVAAAPVRAPAVEEEGGGGGVEEEEDLQALQARLDAIRAA
jgi:charged multivesicular body protein 3